MIMFSPFRDAQGNEFGSFEVFQTFGFLDLGGEPLAPGFYWQAAFPGCLPDGEPVGPFETEQDAIKDATDFV